MTRANDARAELEKFVEAAEERDDTDEVLSVQEAAEFLKIHSRTLSREINRDKVPHRRIGNRIRLSRSGLIAWLSAGATRCRRCGHPDEQ